MGKVAGYAFCAALICIVLYGIYWGAKTLSYQIFYESMVRETVSGMVKENCLR